MKSAATMLRRITHLVLIDDPFLHNDQYEYHQANRLCAPPTGRSLYSSHLSETQTSIPRKILPSKRRTIGTEILRPLCPSLRYSTGGGFVVVVDVAMVAGKR